MIIEPSKPVAPLLTGLSGAQGSVSLPNLHNLSPEAPLLPADIEARALYDFDLGLLGDMVILDIPENVPNMDDALENPGMVEPYMPPKWDISEQFPSTNPQSEDWEIDISTIGSLVEYNLDMSVIPLSLTGFSFLAGAVILYKKIIGPLFYFG